MFHQLAVGPEENPVTTPAPPAGVHPDLRIEVDLPVLDAKTEWSAALSPAIYRALRVYAWDSASVFACASSFVLMFYLRGESQKTGEYGYLWQNALEGVISVAVVYPFALKSRYVNGDNHREAIRKMAKNIPVYLFLNSSFQPTKDWCAAIEKNGSMIDIDFVKYANSSYGTVEALSALGAFGVGFAVAYYALCKLMRLPVTALDVTKAGLQYYLSYLTGAVFNTDLSVGISRLPNVFYTGLTLSGVNYLYDVLTNREIMHALRQRHCVRSLPSAEPATTVATTRTENAVADEKQEHLLSAAEQAETSSGSPHRATRWKASCYEIVKSYCCFWNTAKTTSVRPETKPALLAAVSPR